METYNKEFTKITLHHYLDEFSFDPGHNDVNLTELLEGFVGLLVGSGFSYNGIIEEMHEFAAERMSIDADE